MNELEKQNNEIMSIDKVKEAFKDIYEEKGLKKMAYKKPFKAKEGNGGVTKYLTGWSKDTLNALAFKLGLKISFTEMQVISNNADTMISVKATIVHAKSGEGVAEGYGGYQMQEIRSKMQNEVPRNFMILGLPVAQKRAVSIALTPLLKELGLDYETFTKEVNDDIFKEERAKNPDIIVETVANVDDLIEQDKAEKYVDGRNPITEKEINALGKSIDNMMQKGNGDTSQLKRELQFVLLQNHGIDISGFAPVMSMLEKLTMQEYNIIKANILKAKANK